MDPATATKIVQDVLHEIQTGQDLDCPPLNDEIVPIRDLKKFDSPVSLAATGMIERRLGIQISPEINIFGDGKGLYSIGKTVATLCKLAEEAKQGELEAI